MNEEQEDFRIACESLRERIHDWAFNLDGFPFDPLAPVLDGPTLVQDNSLEICHLVARIRWYGLCVGVKVQFGWIIHQKTGEIFQTQLFDLSLIWKKSLAFLYMPTPDIQNVWYREARGWARGEEISDVDIQYLRGNAIFSFSGLERYTRP